MLNLTAEWRIIFDSVKLTLNMMRNIFDQRALKVAIETT